MNHVMEKQSKHMNRSAWGKILIVDDDLFFRNRIEEILAGAGFQCHTSSCGVDAIKSFLQDGRNYMCAIMDVHMTDMGGIEAGRIIRCRDKDFPIVLMTADDSLETELEARSIGISYFLKKPFVREELLDLVRKLASPCLSD